MRGKDAKVKILRILAKYDWTNRDYLWIKVETEYLRGQGAEGLLELSKLEIARMLQCSRRCENVGYSTRLIGDSRYFS